MHTMRVIFKTICRQLILRQFLISLFNESLSAGVQPAAFKLEYVKPRLKKPEFDAINLLLFSQSSLRSSSRKSAIELPDNKESVSIKLSSSSFFIGTKV
jgi:hypothetical protein